MPKILKTEPVMCAAVALSALLALAIQLGYLSLEDLTGYVQTFGAVLLILGPVALGGWVRSKVTPAGGAPDKGASRQLKIEIQGDPKQAADAFRDGINRTQRKG